MGPRPVFSFVSEKARCWAPEAKAMKLICDRLERASLNVEDAHGSAWKEVEHRLEGAGQFYRQLDNCRFILPSRLFRKLESMIGLEWIMSVWFDATIRVLPGFLWKEYIMFVHSSLKGVVSPGVIDDVITALAKPIRLDAQKRWTIPAELANQAGLTHDKCSIVLTPQHVWIGICEAQRSQKALQQAIQNVQAALRINTDVSGQRSAA